MAVKIVDKLGEELVITRKCERRPRHGRRARLVRHRRRSRGKLIWLTGGHSFDLTVATHSTESLARLAELV